MGSVVLKKGREESLRRFHPWIFSGAVESVSGNLREGDAVDVLAHDGSFLAVGHWQKGSIAVRVLGFTDEFMPEEDAMMPDGFWEAGIARAWQLRKDLELAVAGMPLPTVPARTRRGRFVAWTCRGYLWGCGGDAGTFCWYVSIFQTHSCGSAPLL